MGSNSEDIFDMSGALPITRLHVDGRECTVLIDTGSTDTIIYAPFCAQWRRRVVRVTTISGDDLKCSGIGSVTVEAPTGHRAALETLVVDERPLGVDMVLGVSGISALGGVTVLSPSVVRFCGAVCRAPPDIETPDFRVQFNAAARKCAERVVAHFAQFGLDCKPPERAASGARLLGLRVHEENGQLRWKRDNTHADKVDLSDGEVYEEMLNSYTPCKGVLEHIRAQANVGQDRKIRGLRHVRGDTDADAMEQHDERHPRCVFTPEQEDEPAAYVLAMEERLFGLTTDDLKKLTERNQLKHSFDVDNERGGADWLRLFPKRHPELSLRRPEPTSAARARGFNRAVVEEFFGLVEKVIDENKLPPNRIYNCDKTGITTVPKTQSLIIAKRGKKQVGALTSAERPSFELVDQEKMMRERIAMGVRDRRINKLC
ncbi:hypothetical protein FJT64_020068 [Amphibalanus amphitrite]|uniref:Uncharacterized protein n=1 Tax=Amphibalanus amphitrite TaxID=1232801 RepID=A0A6A4X395_AMPAM|nr:hypothetical protein FJT64_020068 [Amphibalanus amphitrite]